MSYIKELPSVPCVDEVLFVSPRVTYSDRSSMGWGTEYMESQEGLTFYIAPDEETVQSIYRKNEGTDTYCLYSGINDFPELARWMQMGLAYNIKRGIITERPNVYWNKPLWLHKLRFLFRTQRYVRYFDYVFGIGNLALDYYRTFSNQWKLVPWGYCTECKDVPNRVATEEDSPLKMVFVGTVNKNKNVISVIKSMVESNLLNTTFDIIGDGPERMHAEKYVKDCGIGRQVTFHGYRRMDEVHGMLPDYDMLVLPSLYDGWGAVVNEALQRGLYVLCSDKCGAQSLLTQTEIGRVFHGYDEMKSMLHDIESQRAIIRSNKNRRINWAECISGNAMANYMVQNLMSDEPLPALWKKTF